MERVEGKPKQTQTTHVGIHTGVGQQMPSLENWGGGLIMYASLYSALTGLGSEVFAQAHL